MGYPPRIKKYKENNVYIKQVKTILGHTVQELEPVFFSCRRILQDKWFNCTGRSYITDNLNSICLSECFMFAYADAVQICFKFWDRSAALLYHNCVYQKSCPLTFSMALKISSAAEKSCNCPPSLRWSQYLLNCLISSSGLAVKTASLRQ